MPGNLQPLVNNQPIVRQDGTPTDYFIRWAQQKQIDITSSITAEQAQQLIDDFAGSRSIIAGAGLTGGGTLAADVTLDVNPGTGLTITSDQVRLTNTGVTAGAYTNANITIDAQGRITVAANGTGGSATWGSITGTLSAQTDLQTALNAKANATITISAGTGLTGGGDLTANRTLTLANTAVTPGSYTYGSFTVDAQGRLTAASSGATPVAAVTSTNLAIAKFNGTSGQIQNSGVLIDATNNVTGVVNLTTTGNGAFNGAPIATNYGINIYNVSTNPSTFQIACGFSTSTTLNSAANANVIYGVLGDSLISGNQNATGGVIGGALRGNYNGSAVVTKGTGVQGLMYNQSTGRITSAYGVNGTIQNLNASGTMGTAAQLYAGGGFNFGGLIDNFYGVLVDSGYSNVTNCYGLYIKTQTTGATLNYAIYSAGGQSYHAGKFGIGTVTPAEQLDVTGNAKVSGTVSVADDAYSASWDGNLTVPTKNAVYDKINSLPVASFTKLEGFIADVGNSTTTETDLFTYTLAANQLVADKDVVFEDASGVFVSSGTATRQIRAYFGGTMIFDTGALTLSLSSAWVIRIIIIRVSSTVIRYSVNLSTQGAALAAYTSSGQVTGLTLSATNILKITGQAAGVGAATNDIVAKNGYVAYIGAAAGSGGGGGGSTPSLVQVKTGIGNTFAVTMTSTPTAGNLMVAICTHWNNLTSANTGWNLIYNGNGVSTDGYATAWKVALPGESTTQTPFIGGVGGQSTTIFELANAALYAPMVSNFQKEITTSPMTVPLTAPRANMILVGIAAEGGSNTAFTVASTGPSITIDENVTGTTSSNSPRRTQSFHSAVTSLSQNCTITTTFTPGNMVGVTVAISGTV